MSVSEITHQGKKIVYVDFRQCKTNEDVIALMRKSAAFHQSLNRTNLLTLDDFRDTPVKPNREIMDVAKQLAAEVMTAIRHKSAVLGITGVRKVFLKSYSIISRDNVLPFETKEEALDWLVQ